MNEFIVLFILLSASMAFASGWISFGTSEYGDEYYYDVQSIHREGNIVEVTYKIKFMNERWASDYNIQKVRIDCQLDWFCSLESYWHYKDGSYEFHTNSCDRSNIPYGSMMHWLWAEVCDIEKASYERNRQDI